MKQGVVIVFPGTGYTCKEKLLVQCTKKYADLGYDILNLDFSGIPFREIKVFEEAIERTKLVILNQLKGISFEEYKDVIFISKSLGTACVNWVANYLSLTPRQLYLTPLKDALESIDATSKVMGMVIGKEDRHLDYKVMESFCLERKIPYLIIEGVGHDLMDYEDEIRTAEINEKIVNLCC